MNIKTLIYLLNFLLSKTGKYLFNATLFALSVTPPGYKNGFKTYIADTFILPDVGTKFLGVEGTPVLVSSIWV